MENNQVPHESLSSPSAQNLVCSIMETCQSCGLMSQKYEQQLSVKEKHFYDLVHQHHLQSFLADQHQVEVQAAPRAYHYRHTAKLAVSPHKSQYSYSQMQAISPPPYIHTARERKRFKKQSFQLYNIGLYRPQTHQVLDLSPCIVHCHPIQQLLSILQSYLPWSGIRCYQTQSSLSQRGILRYVICRVKGNCHAVSR